MSRVSSQEAALQELSNKLYDRWVEVCTDQSATEAQCKAAYDSYAAIHGRLLLTCPPPPPGMGSCIQAPGCGPSRVSAQFSQPSAQPPPEPASVKPLRHMSVVI